MSTVNGRADFFGRLVSAARWKTFRISETRYGCGAFLPPHCHEESYLTFVLAGAYTERAKNGHTRTCEERSVVLHPAGDTHEDDFQRPTRCLNVVIGPSFTARLGAAAAPLERGDVIDGAEVMNVASRLAAEMRRNDSAGELIVEGLLLELFGTIARDRREERPTRGWLGEVHAIVSRRFAEKITLTGLAAEAGVHATHLARAFRKRYGLSVGEYVRELRIAAAREGIARGAALATLAGELGFADQSHFTRTFRRVAGMSPAEYRRRLR